jgi:hypothetical protein
MMYPLLNFLRLVGHLSCRLRQAGGEDEPERNFEFRTPLFQSIKCIAKFIDDQASTLSYYKASDAYILYIIQGADPLAGPRIRLLVHRTGVLQVQFYSSTSTSLQCK